MLGLTSHLAGMASDTAPEVNDHSPSHFFFHEDFSYENQVLFHFRCHLIFFAQIFIESNIPHDIRIEIHLKIPP
jgi:hypothetical protein